MAMPFELPDELADRVSAAASARGVPPQQVVIEAVEARLASGSEGAAEVFSDIRNTLRAMAFDGSLRAEIDGAVDDPELSVS